MLNDLRVTWGYLEKKSLSINKHFLYSQAVFENKKLAVGFQERANPRKYIKD